MFMDKNVNNNAVLDNNNYVVYSQFINFSVKGDIKCIHISGMDAFMALLVKCIKCYNRVAIEVYCDVICMYTVHVVAHSSR